MKKRKHPPISEATQKQIQKWTDLFSESAISIYAGQTAFFIMLSFFPFMLLFFSILKLTPLPEAEFLAWAAALVPSSFEGFLSGFINSIYNSSSAGITVSVIFALWLCSKAMVSLQYGLDSMYQVKETRNYLWLRALGILYSIIFAIVLILLLGLMVFGKMLREYLFPNFEAVSIIVKWRPLIIIPFLFLFFWISYAMLPNKKHGFKQHIPGALFAAVAWTGFSWIFSIYVNRWCNYASVYGTMTTIALIMVWLYTCMYMVFLGGLINSIIAMRPNLRGFFHAIKERRKLATTALEESGMDEKTAKKFASEETNLK